MKKTLYIYCSGGAGTDVIDMCRRIQDIHNRWENIYFIDDVRKDKNFYGTSVITYDDFKANADKAHTEVVIANGEPAARKTLYEKVEEDGYDFATVIANTAIVSKTATLGKGSIIGEFCHISANACVKDNVYVNITSIVGHGSVVGKNTYISIGVKISGGTKIGENCFIAAGASFKGSMGIGDWNIVAMNSAVTKDFGDNNLVGGVPARVIKENSTHKVFK